jgi:AcrR family transcriptional regulator
MTPRRGRRVAGSDTRGEILAAARAMFGESGYAATTLRGVAKRAGVDPALIIHHFGSKEALFRSAMHVSFDPAAIATIIASGDGDSLGERICLYFLALWEDEATREPLLATLRSALTHDAAAQTLREFLSEALVERVAHLLGTPDAPLRATLVGSQLVGLAVARYVLRIEPLASADRSTVVAWVAPTLERYLTPHPASSPTPLRFLPT